MEQAEANKYIATWSPLLDGLFFHVKLLYASDSQPGKQSRCNDVTWDEKNID